MISLGDLLVFFAAVAITLAYVLILHRFLSGSDPPPSPPGPPQNRPRHHPSSDDPDAG